MMQIPDGMQLTEKDCETLLEAIDAWVRGDGSGSLMSTLMLASVGMSEEKLKNHSKQIEERHRTQEDSRRRIAILLKAKVELLRQSLQSKAIEAGGGK